MSPLNDFMRVCPRSGIGPRRAGPSGPPERPDAGTTRSSYIVGRPEGVQLAICVDVLMTGSASKVLLVRTVIAVVAGFRNDYSSRASEAIWFTPILKLGKRAR